MLKVRKEKDEIIVSVNQINRINTFFTEFIEDELKSLVPEAHAKICFNLSGIRFIDTEGFNMLREVKKYISERGSELVLCNAGRDVKELFDLMELSNEFRFENKRLGRDKVAVDVDQLYFTLK